MNSPSVQVLSPLLACICDTVHNVGLSYPDLFTCDNYTGLPYPDLFACIDPIDNDCGLPGAGLACGVVEARPHQRGAR